MLLGAEVAGTEKGTAASFRAPCRMRDVVDFSVAMHRKEGAAVVYKNENNSPYSHFLSPHHF